jgi:hypothetical protein
MRVLAVRVAGESMLPALRSGDLLLVRPGARVGDIVVARHPGEPGRLIVKRAAGHGADGRQDSWDFGAVPDALVVGRAVLRYWPPSRWSSAVSPSLGPRGLD